MDCEKNLTLNEINFVINGIQSQLDKLRTILNTIALENKDLLEQSKKAEESVKKLNIDEMKIHGSSTEEIVNWYWDNYHHTAIFVTTPNGNHPIDYNEWTEGRIKNNKEATPEFYKDFMIRVIDKGGYIQVIPF